MLKHPEFDPVALDLGLVQIHWYGFMYLLGFLMAYILGQYRIRRSAGRWRPEELSDLVFYAAIGVIAGGRLGYVLFYDFQRILDNPIELFYIWQGGMSFHGGLIGVFAAICFFARKSRRSILEVGDFVAPLCPLGLMAGRIGNFINQELWGKVTDMPWGVVFSNGGPLPRHPSQLYEAFLEGLVLFIILWWFSSKPRPRGMVSGLFLLGYSIFRIIVEFVRIPDAHLGYLALNWITMGHILSLPLAALGIFLIVRAMKEQPRHAD